MIVIAVILLSAAQAADYLYQADLHGWYNPVWRNGYRAPKWGMWDFIPHDGWHIAQSTRNFGDAVGVTLACLAAFSIIGLTPAIWWHTLICLAASLAVRALLRGLFFSLPSKLYN